MFTQLMALRFNLIETPRGQVVQSPIVGKVIVFTGTMAIGKRDDMAKQAKALGATVGSAVSKNTDMLVTGSNVGASKTEAAAKLGVTLVTEGEYLKLLGEV
jgi:DNA ligase (NAD+)